jgi:hypothetical protein
MLTWKIINTCEIEEKLIFTIFGQTMVCARVWWFLIVMIWICCKVWLGRHSKIDSKINSTPCFTTCSKKPTIYFQASSVTHRERGTYRNQPWVTDDDFQGITYFVSCLSKTIYNPFPFMPFLKFEEEKFCWNRKSQHPQPQWLTPDGFLEIH